MKVYSISVSEVWNRTFFIKANSKEDAIKEVDKLTDQGKDGYFEYSHTLDSDLWTVDVVDPTKGIHTPIDN